MASKSRKARSKMPTAFLKAVYEILVEDRDAANKAGRGGEAADLAQVARAYKRELDLRQDKEVQA